MSSITVNNKLSHYTHFKVKGVMIFLGFLSLLFFANSANAGLILNHPNYTGLNNGLVGWWSFDGKDMGGVTAFDHSGQNNSGTLTGGPSRTIGKIGQGLSFDGNDDVRGSGINIANSAFTISAWIKTSSFSNDVYIAVGSENGLYDPNRDNKGLALQLTSATTINYSFYANDHTVTVSNMTGRWTHLVAVYTGTQASFYQDGVQVLAPVAKGAFSGTSAWGIGSWESTSNTFGGYFTGSMDDVSIYNRALSGDEIKRLYKIGATLKINTSINNDSLANGLVGYWSMNAPDVAGTTAYDRSGNSKNGSFLGQDISPSGLVGWWKLDGASSGSIANVTTVDLEASSRH